MTDQPGSARARLARTGLLLAAGFLVGYLVDDPTGPRPARAVALAPGDPGPGPSASNALPAIALSPDEIALVAAERGGYFLVGRNAQAVPVILPDAATRLGPAESVLRVHR